MGVVAGTEEAKRGTHFNGEGVFPRMEFGRERSRIHYIFSEDLSFLLKKTFSKSVLSCRRVIRVGTNFYINI